jgi:hypothetical protein
MHGGDTLLVIPCPRLFRVPQIACWAAMSAVFLLSLFGTHQVAARVFLIVGALFSIALTIRMVRLRLVAGSSALVWRASISPGATHAW